MNPTEQTLPLKGIALPPEISWWPLAYGWWIVIGLVLIALIAAFFVVRHLVEQRRHNPKREALNALLVIEQSSTLTRQQAALECNTLLKRTALSLYPREQVASLSGKAWLAFLIAHTEKPLAQELEALIGSLYQADTDTPVDQKALKAFTDVTRAWISSAKERWQGV